MTEAAAAYQPSPSAMRAKFGMWLFLGSEIMFFAAFIGAYVVLRNASPVGGPFDHANRHLSVPLATINTLVLIVSSFTMAMAVNSIQHGNRALTQLLILFTMVLGTTFLVIKGFEYASKFHHGIYPSTNVFYGSYFLLTGFHGFHVLAGILVLGVMFVLTGMGRFSPENYTGLECTGLYWHLVDVVWIFLFPLLYLL